MTLSRLYKDGNSRKSSTSFGSYDLVDVARVAVVAEMWVNEKLAAASGAAALCGIVVPLEHQSLAPPLRHAVSMSHVRSGAASRPRALADRRFRHTSRSSRCRFLARDGREMRR